MKHFLVFFILFLPLSAFSQEVTSVCFDNGRCVEIPEGMEVRFVPEDAPETLVAVEGIKTVVVEPEETCEPKLVAGGAPKSDC